MNIKIGIVEKEKVLHKFFREYTDDDFKTIKTNKCSKCKYKSHIGGVPGVSENTPAIVNHLICDYLNKTGNKRPCRPELCKFYIEGAENNMNQETHEKFVDFETYCEICKNKDLSATSEPCSECLSNPVNFESSKPVNFKKKEQ